MKTSWWLGVGLLMAGGVPGWAAEGCRGHWSGGIEVPQQTLSMEIDLDRAGSGWVGTVSIPAQNASGLPLDAISGGEDKCSFRIKGVPGEPTFNGNLSDGGKTMSGEFVQRQATLNFKFTRSGEPKIEAEKPSPAISKSLLGTWEGALEVGGQTLRLVLKMSNEGNAGKAVLISLDQGGVEIPVSTIEQKDAKLKLGVKMVGGGYDAEINKEGTELSGTWSQAGNQLPLKMKKKS